MSKQLKAPEKTSEKEQQADFPLDKYIFRAGTYGLAGFGVGLAASLFFKHKLPITALFTGAGAGYGMHGLTEDWQNHQKFKSWMNTQTQQRSGDNSQGGRDLDSFNFDQYVQAQKNREWTRQSKDQFRPSDELKRDDTQLQQKQKQDQQKQDKDSSSKLERKKSDQEKEKADTQQLKRDQKEQGKDSSFKFEGQGQKSSQEKEKADSQRQKRDQKEQDRDLSSKLERKKSDQDKEKADSQKRDQQKQDKDSSSKLERKKSDQEKEKADTQQRQKRDQKDQDNSKFERQGLQTKQEGKWSEQQGQQSKQQSQQFKRQSYGGGDDDDEPMNPEAKAKKNQADKPLENQEPIHKMGKGHKDYPFSQDKGKKVEDSVYSQSMQGTLPNYDDIQRGERGPQNPSIPPSQRDWTGGHANKGVNQQQVHRGTPEADKMGKSVRPDTEPNKNPDKNAPQQGNQALANVDFSGQKLQTFESNPLKLGKAGPTHEIQKNYQEGRNRQNDPNLDNTRRRIAGLEQDRMGKSVKEGTLFTHADQSDTKAGVHNYRPVAEQNLKNQVNAVIE